MKPTCFKKGVTPHNKGVKQEPSEQGDIKPSYYLRPSQSEVVMAGQDPLRPYWKLKQGESDSGGESVMVLRPKLDLPSEVEMKNLGLKCDK